MKREPVVIGQECAFWTVVSGPLPGMAPAFQKSWECRCRCGKEKTILDHNLKNIRDGRSNERFWSCGCVAKELRKLEPKPQPDYSLRREFVPC